MPQFDPANFPSQMIWLAAIFFVLYFLVIKTTLPKVGSIVDQRTAVIDADLSAAAAARDEAMAANSGFEHVLTDARTTATKSLNDAKSAASAATDSKVKTVDATLATKVGDAEHRIATMRTAALQDINTVAAEAASDIVQRLTGMGVSAGDAAAAVTALKA
jgi:F-type H+-transporting ATPase subunit b